MNQTFLKGLTATLLLTLPGLAVFGPAAPSQGASRRSEPQVATAGVQVAATGSRGASTSEAASEDLVAEVVKVGERQSQSSQANKVVAKVQTHQVNGQPAATLYVRDIPVLTFLGTSPASQEETKLGVTSAAGSSTTVEASTPRPNPTLVSRFNEAVSRTINGDAAYPLARATAIAAKLNQMARDAVDAKTITVRWDNRRQRYLIQTAGKPLVELSATTFLADSTRNLEQDALQVANRLRRLMGDAPALTEIADKPQPARISLASRTSSQVKRVTTGLARLSGQGIASWYGPGFHGNASASGEIFNQNALTAAHRSLPFGTKVRVTNLDNGRSVVVRINDRGPFTGGRVIDLSEAAARVLGLIRSGVAPVRLDVMF